MSFVLPVRLMRLRLLRVSGIAMRVRMFLLLIPFLTASRSLRNRPLVARPGRDRRPARAGRPSREAELPVRLDRRDADADETERSWPVGEGAVEEPARERPDLAAVVGARGEGRGAAADREVAVAELRRHRASAPAVGAQELGHPLRHRPQLVVEPVPVGEVDLERLLLADRDARRREVERTRIDALRAVAKEPADLSGNEPRKLCLAEARERADGLDARVAETLLGAWSHAGQEPDGERGED